MGSILLKAKPVYKRRVEGLKKCLRALKARGITPHLKVFLVGNNPASLIYTRRKKQFIEELGGLCEILQFPENMGEHEFQGELKKVCPSPEVHGCFVQLPLPTHLAHLDVGQMIPAHKDVDGFHQKNLYHLLQGNEMRGLCPCTPKGIISLLKEYNIELARKNALVIGRSLIVGKPLALLLLKENASVSICHSHTKNLMDYTYGADLIISAVGSAGFFTRRFLNPKRRDQTLVDVGINRLQSGEVCGDMDFEGLKDFCGAITPVPGGVGPMTILSLAENLLIAAERGAKVKK